VDNQRSKALRHPDWTNLADQICTIKNELYRTGDGGYSMAGFIKIWIPGPLDTIDLHALRSS
jgi:hypothetical protein